MSTMWDKFDKALHEQGLTQKELEAILGLAENRITKWKAGQGGFPVNQALRLAHAVGLSLDYMADDTQVEPAFGYTLEDRMLFKAFRASGLTWDRIMEMLFEETRSINASQASSGDMPEAR